MDIVTAPNNRETKVKGWSNHETWTFVLHRSSEEYEDAISNAIADIREESGDEGVYELTLEICTQASYRVISDIIERLEEEWDDLWDSHSGEDLLRDLAQKPRFYAINKDEIAELWAPDVFEVFSAR